MNQIIPRQVIYAWGKGKGKGTMTENFKRKNSLILFRFKLSIYHDLVNEMMVLLSRRYYVWRISRDKSRDPRDVGAKERMRDLYSQTRHGVCLTEICRRSVSGHGHGRSSNYVGHHHGAFLKRGRSIVASIQSFAETANSWITAVCSGALYTGCNFELGRHFEWILWYIFLSFSSEKSRGQGRYWINQKLFEKQVWKFIPEQNQTTPQLLRRAVLEPPPQFLRRMGSWYIWARGTRPSLRSCLPSSLGLLLSQEASEGQTNSSLLASARWHDKTLSPSDIF